MNKLAKSSKYLKSYMGGTGIVRLDYEFILLFTKNQWV